MKLRPYTVYKDSGVPWLGKVPEHWEVRRARNVIDMRVSNVDKHMNEGEQPVRLCNYVDVYKNDRITERLLFMQAAATAEEIERFRLECGDVLITKDSESWNDIGVAALVEYTAEDLICGYHLALLRPRKTLLSGAYLLRALQTPAVAYQFHVAANGVTRYGLSHDAIKSVLLPIPPLPEQAAIVRFLDHMDRRIRRYISGKQKLIKLLEEQKQAIIHRAVTRGLDPGVRFKPSSIDWLGDLPRHWETLPFTKCAVDHADYRGATPEKVESGVFLVTAKNIRMGWIDYETSKEYVRADKYEEIMRRGLPKLGDLLLTTEAPLGHVALVDCEEIALAQRIIRFRMDERRLLPKFALYSMMSPYFQWQLQIRATGSTAEGIKASNLPQLLILRAPIEEQQRIIIWIERNVQRFEQLIEEAQREIDLICEYRSRLITDVVTGKLDVRDVELPTADETAGLECFDDNEAVDDVAEDTDKVEGIEEEDAG